MRSMKFNPPFPSTGCVHASPEDLEEYHFGRTPAWETQCIASHLERCGVCRNALKDLRLFICLLSQAVEDHNMC